MNLPSALLAIMATLFAAAAALAADERPSHPQWLAFCAGQNGAPVDLCAPHTPASVQVNDKTWDAINTAWRASRADLFYISDLEATGRPDVWRYPADGWGDCEDAAIWTMAELVQAGLPRGAMRLSIIDTPDTGAHAILLIQTDAGVLEIDTLRDDLRRSDIGHQRPPLAVQQPGRPAAWVMPRRLVLK